MKFEEYLDSLRGKSVAVIGIGVSNRPLIRLLLERGIGVTACDKKSREALGPLGDELEQHGLPPPAGGGLPEGPDGGRDLPHPRPAARRAGAGGGGGAGERTSPSRWRSFLRSAPVQMIAVTGSDGKTTTTTIIAKLLEAAGRTVHLGGNIGRPLLCDTPDIAPDGPGGAGAQLLPADDHGRAAPTSPS